jgi:7-cyano-7-deazaguanine synthase in queuosine biosynthesis
VTFRRLVIGPSVGRLGTDTFAWRSTRDESSFHTNLDPELRWLGDVPLAHRDLVAFATAVFLADRTVGRPRGWRRSIELEVPVYDVARWEALADHFTGLLELLSSDTWRLSFTPRTQPKKLEVSEHPEVDRVLLFSGGADSLCGAIRSLANGERLLLVSHWDWAGHAGVQNVLVRRLAVKFPKQLVHRVVHLSRRRTQIGGGTFGDEATRRTRSLLFLSLGLADASVAPVAPLWIAENGYAALNPPLAGERRGALSTRTTHPLVLSRVQDAVRQLGGRAEFENPFASMTKGEMYTECAAAIGKGDAEKVLALSHSCSHVRYAQGTGYPPATQCGVCFGCLVRRAAFHAAGLADTATYLNKAIAPVHQPHHLRATAESEIRTVRYAGSRGLDVADILSVGLPEGMDIDDALRVAQRGLAELAAVVEVEPDLRDVR